MDVLLTENMQLLDIAALLREKSVATCSEYPKLGSLMHAVAKAANLILFGRQHRKRCDLFPASCYEFEAAANELALEVIAVALRCTLDGYPQLGFTAQAFLRGSHFANINVSERLAVLEAALARSGRTLELRNEPNPDFTAEELELMRDVSGNARSRLRRKPQRSDPVEAQSVAAQVPSLHDPPEPRHVTNVLGFKPEGEAPHVDLVLRRGPAIIPTFQDYILNRDGCKLVWGSVKMENTLGLV